MKYGIFWAICVGLLAGCSINGSLQRLYGYYEKTRAQHPQLIQTSDGICGLSATDTPRVYAIRGATLLPRSVRKCLTLCLESQMF